MSEVKSLRRSSRERRPPARYEVQGAASERVAQLRRSRSGHMADVTRAHEHFRTAYVSGDVAACCDCLSRLQSAFDKFKEKHLQYVQLAIDCGCEQRQYAELELSLRRAQSDLAELEAGGVWSDDRLRCPSEVNPDDSVSQHGSGASSHVSSASSARVKASARKAALQVKRRGLREEQDMEVQRLRFKSQMEVKMKQFDHKLSSLQLQSELAAAAAEEETLVRFVDGGFEAKVDRSDSRVGVTFGDQNMNNVHDNKENILFGVSGVSLGPPLAEQPLLVTEPESKPVQSPGQTLGGPPPAFDLGLGLGGLNPLAPEWPGNQTQCVMPVSTCTPEKFIDLMALPKGTLMTFDGDPTKFALFMNSFDNTVGKAQVDDGVKLNRLLEYCQGRAAKLIQPCVLLEPTLGYQRARDLLTQRFGNYFKIAQACVNRVVKCPAIKPGGQALQDFVDEIRACVETLKALRKLDEVDTRSRMLDIVKKLPVRLQDRWRRKAIDHVDIYGYYPSIDSLLTFLDRVCREVTDPVYGDLFETQGSASNNSKRGGVPGRGRGSSFNVNVGSTGPPDGSKPGKGTQEASSGSHTASGASQRTQECYKCKGNHRLVTCKGFLEMTPESRLQLVRGRRLCFCCLESRSHAAGQCVKGSSCGVKGCGRRHHKILHEAFVKGDAGELETKTDVKAQNFASGASCAGVALPVISVKVRACGQDQYITVNALLDPGSNRSFCSQELLDKLSVEGEEADLTLATLSGRGQTQSAVVSLEVTSSNTRGKRVVSLPRVYALPKFPDLSSSTVSPSDVEEWDHLRDVGLPSSVEGGVLLLIGQDAPQALVPLEVRHGPEGAPYAVRTVLGWSINGPIGDSTVNDVGDTIANFVQGAPCADIRLETQVRRFWELDYAPELSDSQMGMSCDDKKVYKLWEETTTMEGYHYVMRIPVKSENLNLPESINLAKKRLQSLGRRLAKDPDLHTKYSSEIQKLLDKGFAEPAPDGPTLSGSVWYLPHHPVTNPNKPGKLRIVFDCAAQIAGTSLNKQVLQGPDLTNSLVGVLQRFRQFPIAFMTDIEGMFLQVRVPPDQRDLLRFLWWPDGDLSKPPGVYRMCIHLFGGIWSPSAASYALKRVAIDNQENFDQETIATVQHNFYMDDCLKSRLDNDSAKRTAVGLSQLLPRGGFRLMKWTSNSDAALEAIPAEDRLDTLRSLDLDQGPTTVERALGVSWNITDDMFSIKIREKDIVHTRRGLLSVVSSVYDPLGLVAPHTLQAKKLFQMEVKAGKGWDDRLSDVVDVKWSAWLRDLHLLENFKIARCLVPCDFGIITSTELHYFSDASEDAYGAVAYIRMVNNTGVAHCAFLMGKARLAPIKTVSIPRLELMGAVLSVKMDDMVRRELGLDGDVTSTFWTDSMIVIQYIQNRTRRFQTFVANRIAMIHTGSEPSQWRHVSTSINPADHASRGLSAKEMIHCTSWSRGPEFLWKDTSDWPIGPEDGGDLLDGDTEVKSEVKYCLTTKTVQKGPFDRLIEKYSEWFRLKKAVAWLMKFCRWLRSHEHKLSTGLTVDDLVAAEQVIYRHVQSESFSEEFRALRSDKAVSRRSNICSLEPVLTEDGLIRVGGRLRAAPLDDATKHPIIMPRDCHVSTLVVRHVHEQLTAHSGREHVLATLRQRLWVPQCRPLINRIIRKCVKCRMGHGALGMQKMADLPEDRLVPDKPPFSHVGVDCFGPFMVKRGRSMEKRYGCLFTCLTTRAIHLEKLCSMESDSFLNAFLRFVSRRGTPERMRSDNGTNFTAAEKELRESISSWERDAKVTDKLLSMDVQWRFNPPAASHMGGIWERQIRTARKVITAILKDQVLNDEGLDTLFCEVESIVNSRPLTAVSDDPKDLKALTPNDLLLLNSNSVAPPGIFKKHDIYTRRWRHVQFLADLFWKRWIREYLPTLQTRSKWTEKCPNLQVGDLVLVACETTPRKSWPLARVIRTYPGKDGLVRSADVQTAGGTYMRPIAKLCPLLTEEPPGD